MDVKTKFKIGDKIHFVRDYKIQEAEVKAIVITANGIGYCETGYGFSSDAIPENRCFESKEALIEDLAKE